MPIVVELGRGFAEPIAVCDRCGRRIERGPEGVYLWPEAGGSIAITHRACREAFERERGGGWNWAALETLPWGLREGLGVNLEEARRRTEGSWGSARLGPPAGEDPAS